MPKSCVKSGCNQPARENSNYCSSHQPSMEVHTSRCQDQDRKNESSWGHDIDFNKSRDEHNG